MDTSLDSGPTESDSDDLPVAVATLELEGVRPKVGDHVDIKVGGTIRKLVDETAFVTPETVNDQPLAPKEDSTSDEDFMASAQAMDAAGGGY